MEPKSSPVLANEVSYWDYLRMAIAMGYVCAEIKERFGQDTYQQVLVLAKRIAGERGCQEIEHIETAFSGLYGLFGVPGGIDGHA